MGESRIPDEQVSSLIDKILEGKDPATVGLRKIIKRKNDESRDFPLRDAKPEEFSSPDQKKKILTDDERRILQLEKLVADSNIRLQKQQETTKQQIEAAYQRGKKEGFDAGEKKGKNDATLLFDKKIEELQKKIALFLKNLEDSKREIFINGEHILVRLCIELTKKIISTELASQSGIIISVLKKALSYIGDRERLIIRIAPEDFETVSGKKDFWCPVTERLKEIVIEQDNRIERGGCIVESNTGIVDARIGVQMEEMFSIIEKTWQAVNSSFDNS